MVKINSAVLLLLSKSYDSRLPGVPNNFYGLAGMLNVDDDAALIDNSSKMLKKQSILQTQNMRFALTFLLSNARTVFSSQNVSPAFFNNARSTSNVRPIF